MTSYVINIATRGDYLIFAIDNVEFKIDFYECWILKDLVSSIEPDGADFQAYVADGISRSVESPVVTNDGSVEFRVLGDEAMERITIPAEVGAAIVAIYLGRNNR